MKKIEILITGDIGSGKSEILKLIYHELKNKNLNIKCFMGGKEFIPLDPSFNYDDREIHIYECWGVTKKEPYVCPICQEEDCEPKYY